MAELVYSVTEAAAALGVSRRTMYELIRREDFPTLKVGGRRLISKALLVDWIRAQAGGQKEAAPSAANTRSGRAEQVLTNTVSVFHDTTF